MKAFYCKGEKKDSYLQHVEVKNVNYYNNLRNLTNVILDVCLFSNVCYLLEQNLYFLTFLEISLYGCIYFNLFSAYECLCCFVL